MIGKFKPQWIRPQDLNIPWMTFDSIDWLNVNIKKEHLLFEWGSGGSTIFFAERAKKVISVEHDRIWFNVVKSKISRLGIKNVKYFLQEPENSIGNKKILGGFKSSSPDYIGKIFMKYCMQISKTTDDFYDWIIIDGRARITCIYFAMNKVKKEGHIILDNSEREVYSLGIKLLRGLKRKDFYGKGPLNNYDWCTSVFTKP